MNIHGIRKISDYLYEIPKSYRAGMRVPARIYASPALLENMDDAVLNQITNVAMLPGIIKHSICMPDGHSGYGFPIGGVAAIDPDEGVISPGGIGYDINCGVRLMATSLTFPEVKPVLKNLVQALYNRVPSGVGSDGMVRLSQDSLDEAITLGARWAVQNGYGDQHDLDSIEEGGCMQKADPRAISARARERGKEQIGSLGSGNHYLEIQVARKNNIFDRELAARFGIVHDDQVLVMIHSGSRGFGHQVATDYLKKFLSVMGSKYGISMPDRELACAPFSSVEGQDYYRAMNCAINYAFLNRQMIMHMVKNVFCDVFKKNPSELGLQLVYDVCHNTAKIERQVIDGMEQELLIHRKGATRAFAPGMRGLPERYRHTGQPVLIGGSMETCSYLLAGVSTASETFFSTCHGSGRVMSRHKAKSIFNGRELQKKLEENGIYIMTSSFPGLAEEAGGAYKDVDEVIAATEKSGLSKVVAKLIPVGNIKG